MIGSVFRRRRAALALALALPLALSACGGSDGGDSASASADGTSKVTVGVIPIVDVAPIYLGIKQGFFKDEGLDLKLETAQGGAAIVPGVVSGQYQFGFSNTVSLLLANTQNVPIKVVTAGVNANQENGKDFGAVIVKAGSPIKSPKDLAGKKVAVNTLKNINTTTVNEMVRQDGGDPSKIQYVELPFPDIASAVAKGDVDAGQVVEPFLTIAQQQGDTQIGSNYVATSPGLAVGLYFTSKQYAAQHKKEVEEFTSAMNKSLEYAAAHPDEAKQVLTTYTDIDAGVLEKLTLPQWTQEIDKDSIQKLADLAQQDGLVSKSPDLDTLLP
jgi:NitT/TauT family transport system substrate-binding protein